MKVSVVLFLQREKRNFIVGGGETQRLLSDLEEERCTNGKF